MKSIFKLFSFLALLCFALSCTKEANKKYCWQAFDPSGYDATGLILCDKTETEVQAEYPQYWFYKKNEPKFCWQVQIQQGRISYSRHIPVSMKEKMKTYYGYNFTKVDCASFCIWKWHEKRKSKITGLFGPTGVNTEIYKKDSCSTLYIGRKVTVKETTDSIYYREFIEKRP
jgi:hypothetical protein